MGCGEADGDPACRPSACVVDEITWSPRWLQPSVRTVTTPRFGFRWRQETGGLPRARLGEDEHRRRYLSRFERQWLATLHERRLCCPPWSPGCVLRGRWLRRCHRPGRQRVHLLGRRRQAGDDLGTPHSRRAGRGGSSARRPRRWRLGPVRPVPVRRDHDHVTVGLGDGGDRVVALAGGMHCVRPSTSVSSAPARARPSNTMVTGGSSRPAVTVARPRSVKTRVAPRSIAPPAGWARPDHVGGVDQKHPNRVAHCHVTGWTAGPRSRCERLPNTGSDSVACYEVPVGV